MSLLLELDVPGIDWPLAERLVSATQRPGLLAIYGIPRRKWLRRKPRLSISEVTDDGTAVFDDHPNDAAISPGAVSRSRRRC